MVSRNRLQARPRPAVEHRPPPYRRRRLGPGDPAAPEDDSVPLLPLGPDGVRRSSSHEAQPSTPINGGSHDGGNPRAGIQPAVADCGSRAPLAPHLARPPADSRRGAPEGQRGPWGPWSRAWGNGMDAWPWNVIRTPRGMTRRRRTRHPGGGRDPGPAHVGRTGAPGLDSGPVSSTGQALRRNDGGGNPSPQPSPQGEGAGRQPPPLQITRSAW